MSQRSAKESRSRPANAQLPAEHGQPRAQAQLVQRAAARRVERPLGLGGPAERQEQVALQESRASAVARPPPGPQQREPVAGMPEACERVGQHADGDVPVLAAEHRCAHQIDTLVGGAQRSPPEAQRQGGTRVDRAVAELGKGRLGHRDRGGVAAVVEQHARVALAQLRPVGPGAVGAGQHPQRPVERGEALLALPGQSQLVGHRLPQHGRPARIGGLVDGREPGGRPGQRAPGRVAHAPVPGWSRWGGAATRRPVPRLRSPRSRGTAPARRAR